MDGTNACIAHSRSRPRNRRRRVPGSSRIALTVFAMSTITTGRTRRSTRPRRQATMRLRGDLISVASCGRRKNSLALRRPGRGAAKRDRNRSGKLLPMSPVQGVTHDPGRSMETRPFDPHPTAFASEGEAKAVDLPLAGGGMESAAQAPTHNKEQRKLVVISPHRIVHKSPCRMTPTPNPNPQGGGEPTEFAAAVLHQFHRKKTPSSVTS